MRHLVICVLALSITAPAFAQTAAEMAEVERITHMPQTKTSTLSYYGGFYLSAGQPDKALSYYTKMKVLYKEKYGELSPSMIWLNSQIAMCYLKKGDNKTAVAIAKQCLAEIPKVNPTGMEDTLAQAKLCANAVVSGKMPDRSALKPDFKFQELELLKRMEAAKDKGAYSQEYAHSLYELGRLYRLEGKNDKAAESFKSVIYIMDNRIGPLHPAIAPVLKDYALTLDVLGQKDESAKALERIKRIENAPKTESWVGRMQLGENAIRAKKLDVAETELFKAKELARTTEEKVITMNHLAQVMLLEHKVKEAEKMNTEMLALQKNEHLETTLDYAGGLVTAGDIYSAENELDKAEQYYNDGVKLLDSLKLDDKSQHASQLLTIAMAHLGLAKIAKSHNDLKEAARHEELAQQAVKEHNAGK